MSRGLRRSSVWQAVAQVRFLKGQGIGRPAGAMTAWIHVFPGLESET
jgi:hypothetical protein